MSQPSLFPPPGHVPCPHCDGLGYVDADAARRFIEDQPGQVGRHHPATAQKAARQPSAHIRFGSQRYQVLDALAIVGPSTAAEIARLTKLSRNQCATRLGELRTGGYVGYARDGGGNVITRPTGPTDEGRVQYITDAGHAARLDADRKGKR